MKCFVTGGAGFIGSHLVDRLCAQSHQVTVFDNLSVGKLEFLEPHLHQPEFRLVQGDLLDAGRLREAAAGHDIIFHLAANSDIMKAMKDPALDFEQGVRATFHVVEAMRAHNIKQIFYFSGSGVYGDFGKTPMGESTGPMAPKSMYGAAKLSSEAMISAYSHLYDIRAWVLRPANIIGGRPTHGVIYDLIQKLKQDPGKLEILGDGTQSKSYIHVEDIIEAVFHVFEHAREPLNVFNVASDTYIDVRKIAELVVEETNLQNVKLQFGTEARGWRGDVPCYRLGLEKIKATGWRPKLNSEQAVRRTIREILAGEK